MHCEKFGDVVRYRIGTEVYHVLSGPEAIRYALNTHKDNFTKNTRSTKEIRLIVQNSILTNSNEAWYRSRRLMQPAFKKAAIQDYSPILFNTTDVMMQEWDSSIADNPVIDIHHAMTQLTYQIVLRSLMGSDIDSSDSDMEEALKEALVYVYKRIEALVRIPTFVPTPARKRFLQSIAIFDRVVERILKQRRQDSTTEYHDLLNVLLQASQEHQEDGFTDNELRNEILTLLLAGHETTANALSWCFYLLSRNPTIQNQLAESIQTVDTSHPDFANQSDQMEYVLQVFNETMRLYPPVWAFDRLIENDDEITGYRLKKHSELIICPYTLHRNPAYWNAPDVFNPDRFSTLESKNREDYCFIPFGKGPRMCIGMNFAIHEALIILTKLIKRYRFNAIDQEPIEATPGVTLRPAKPILVKLTPRNL
jgi:cytochrome P450